MNLPTLNWRTVLGISLLLAALLSSWAALRNRDKGPATGPGNRRGLHSA